MNKSSIKASPFAHEGSSVGGVMLQVCLALLPCTVFGFYLFGWPAVYTFLLTCITALVTEWVCLYFLNQPWYRLLDGSALLTGWLLAITLPPWAPWWICVLGAFFAIAVGKQLYGGVGQNVFNPAMLARTALLITFPLQMTSWVAPTVFGAETSPTAMESLRITFQAAIPDGMTGATNLGHIKTSLLQGVSVQTLLGGDFVWWHAALGWSAGSLGETSELLVLLGGLWLIWRRIISWEIPASMLTVLMLAAWIFGTQNPDRYAGVVFHLTSGGVVLGAFFIATDPVTSPVGRFPKLLFGAGCGLVIYIIRTWGGFPEAVAFSVLFMNAFTPLIERYFKPRIYGRYANGKPLPKLSAIELAREAQKRL